MERILILLVIINNSIYREITKTANSAKKDPKTEEIKTSQRRSCDISSYLVNRKKMVTSFLI